MNDNVDSTEVHPHADWQNNKSRLCSIIEIIMLVLDTTLPFIIETRCSVLRLPCHTAVTDSGWGHSIVVR